MKVKEVIKLIESDGWYFHNQESSHRHYKHSTKPGKVTVAGKLSDDIPKGTERNILKQAGLK